jgi:hypothetical protein
MQQCNPTANREKARFCGDIHNVFDRDFRRGRGKPKKGEEFSHLHADETVARHNPDDAIDPGGTA